MKTTFASLLRPIASLALAVALAAPVALSSRADAQLGRQLPSPVSAAQLEELLRYAGLPDTTKDAALPLHEAYFARFREFEKNELDPVLSKPNDSPFDLARSVDDAKKEADLRRRAFQRAAQLDAQLVEEIAAVLPAEESWKSVKLRDSLSRRRAAVLAPGFGFGGRPLEYTLRSAPVLATLEPDTARIVNLSLEVYESELTRQLERYADAAFSRIVKAAEIREEMGLTSMPQPAEGEPNPAAPGEEWFRKMREAQRRASEDTDKATMRIRKLHRDGLEQVMPLVPTPEARLLRNHMMSALYPMLREKSPFDTVFDVARTMHDKGELDDAKWHTAMDLADANELASRAIAMDLMATLDKRFASADTGLIVIGDGDASGDDTETKEKVERLQKSLKDLETSNADTLRAAIGLEAAQEGAGGVIERRGIDIGQILNGAEMQVEGAVTIGVAAAGGGGDMIVLSGDDMADGGMFFGSFGGGAQLPRPMGRDELDALAQKLGFAKDARAVFDEIAARAQEARNVAEQESKPAKRIEPDENGALGVGVSITIGDGGEFAFGGGGDNTALLAAIEKAEETMFDELKAAAAADKSDAVEAARRARARTRMLPGESGVQAVDLVAVAEKAALSDGARARIAADLGAWDQSSVDALRTMKREVKALQSERDELFKESMKEETVNDGNGSVSVSRNMQIEGDTAKRLEEIETRISAARTRIGDGNRKTLGALVESLSGDTAAQAALRRAFLRAANPSIYKTPRDLEPFFSKAAAISGVTSSGKSTMDALRAEWIEAREARCEEFCAAQDKRTEASLANPTDGMQQMQARMRERKKLREDLEQIESTIFRRLQDILIVDIGPEKAKELGELPARKKPQMPTIQIGG